jgi:hypothetical protein
LDFRLLVILPVTRRRGQSGPGRPRLEEDRVKRTHLALYVTADEAAALRRAAEKSDRANFSEWARALLLRAISWHRTDKGRDKAPRPPK